MVKVVFAAAISVALAYDDDEAVSLLQLRVQTVQAPKYNLQAVNTLCAEGELLTFAQCVEAQKKEIVESTHQDWSIIYNKRGEARYPNGCYKNQGNGKIYFNDEPIGYTHAQLAPICSKEGGRAAETAAGLTPTCKAEDCSLPAGDTYQILNWGPNVVVPELEILGFGDVCDACGLLTYAQCSKAGDDGTIEEANGQKSQLKMQPSISINGAAHDFPTRPSGCTVRANGYVEFNPYDTVDGQLAGLVSETGVSVGFSIVKPICGKCTTTTTTPPPPPPVDEPVDEPEDDEAFAVADPHMKTNHGDHFDLSAA